MRRLTRGTLSRFVSLLLVIVLGVEPVLAGAAPAFASSATTTSQASADASEPSVAEDASTEPAEPEPTIVREDESRRTATSKHFLMSDGTYRAELFEKPIAFQDESGVWEDIDPTLVPALEPGEFQTSAVADPVTFSTQLDSAQPVLLEGDRFTVGLDMLGVSENARITYGNRTRYLNVATEADLEYEATGSGIKETVVLHSADAPSTYRFFMALDGAELRQTFDGSQFLFRGDDMVGELGQLIVFDSSVNEAGDSAYCADATMTIDAVDGGAYVTYRVSEEWLGDPARVFPVQVDPTVTIYDVSQKPCDDTYVSSAYPTTNYSTSTELKAGYYDSTTGHNRSLVKFNLSSIPTYARIDSAEFKVFQFHTYYTNTATTTYFARPTSYWSHTYNWNNKPTYAYLGQQSVTGRNVWVSQGCGQTVQNWIDGTWYNYGFMIYQSENGSQNTTHWRKFYSGEYGTTSYRPRLVVNYTTVPDTVTGVTGTTSALDWFIEGGTERPNNFPNVGRGEASVSWSPSARATGYKVMLYDGRTYQQVGKVFGNTNTSWSSKDAGIWPTDSQIAALGPDDSYTGNPLTYAATPRAMSQTSSFAVSGQSGAGVTVSDGTYLYTRAWSTSNGSTMWRRIGSGYNGTTAGKDYGGVGPDYAAKPIISAFHLDGFIYNGYVDWIGGKAGIEGVWRDAKEDEADTRRLEFSVPPLDRASGTAVSGSTLNVMLCADEDYIYSIADDKNNGYRHWDVRIFDHDGTFVADKVVANSSYYTDGVLCDGQALYMIEWARTDSARVTKVGLSDFKVVNQWPINQLATDVINGTYDQINKVFWLGGYQQGKVYRYLGSGLDLRDNPEEMYEKVDHADNPDPYNDNENYWFRVIAFNEDAEDAALSGAWTPTLDNRSVNVNDDARHTTHELGDISGHSAIAELDSGALQLDATDLSIASWGPGVSLARRYDSGVTTSGYFSPGWRFNFEQTLVASDSQAIYTDESGEEHVFARDDTSTVKVPWTAPNGMQATLAAEGSGWRLTFKDRSYLLFDSSGLLIAEGDNNDQQTTYARTSTSVTITAANGQRIEVSLSGGKVTSAVYGTQDGTRTVDYSIDTTSAAVTYHAGTSDEYTIEYGYDGDSRLASLRVSPFTQPDGSDPLWGFVYSGGKLDEVRFPGHAIDNHKRSEIDYSGPQATITRSGDVSGTADVAIAQTYEWNPTGTLKQMTDPKVPGATSSTWSYTYSPTNQAITETSPTGKKVNRTLDARDNTLYVTDEESNRTAFVYDDFDQVVRETDPRGATTYYTYDSKGNLLAEEKVLNATGERSKSSYTYSTAGLMLSETVALNATESAVTTYEQHAPNGEPKVTKRTGVLLSLGGVPDELTTTRVYDALGNLLSETDATGVVTASNVYSPGAALRLLESVDASGAVAHRTYDVLGQETASWRTAPGSSAKCDWATSKVDVEGRTHETRSLLSSGAEIGRVTHAFDAMGREVGSDDQWVTGEGVSQLDARGNATTVWAEGTNVAEAIAATRSEYDVYGQLTRTYASGESSATVYQFNVDGTVKKETAPDGTFKAYAYDKSNNRISETDQDGAITTSVYDLGGRLIDSVSPEGVSTTHVFDLAGREVATSGDGEETTTNVYNSLGWLLKTTEADGIITTKAYDKAGRVTSEKVADKAPTTSAYDGRGNLITQVDPDGKVLSVRFDALGRAVAETQVTSDGTVKQTTATYDSAGRLETTDDARTGVSRTHTYPPTPGGSTTLSITYGGLTTTTTIDAKSEETLRSSAAVGISSPVERRITDRDSSRRETAWRVGELAFGRTYRAEDGKLAELAVGDATLSYGYSSGRKTSEQGTLPLAGDLAAMYGYNDVGRLVSSKRGVETSVTYSYDAAGNVRSEVGAAGTRTYDYDQATNELLNVAVGGSVVTTFTFDPYGQRIAQGPLEDPSAERFGYTGTGRVSSYEASGAVATYRFDATGQRIASEVTRTVEGTQTATRTRFVYEGLSLLSLSATETVTSADTTASIETTYSITYLYDAAGAPYAGVYRATDTSPTVFTLVTTDRGDVVELRDVDGAAFAAYAYDPWGVPLGTTMKTGAAGAMSEVAERQPLRYASYFWDAESSTYYLSARNYDPETRQFLSKDPAKDDGEESAYQYCRGNPIDCFDPTGRHTIWRYRMSEATLWAKVVYGTLTGALARAIAGTLAKEFLKRWAVGRVIGAGIKRYSGFLYRTVKRGVSLDSTLRFGRIYFSIFEYQNRKMYLRACFKNTHTKRRDHVCSSRWNLPQIYLGVAPSPLSPILRRSSYSVNVGVRDWCRYR